MRKKRKDIKNKWTINLNFQPTNSKKKVPVVVVAWHQFAEKICQDVYSLINFYYFITQLGPNYNKDNKACKHDKSDKTYGYSASSISLIWVQ